MTLCVSNGLDISVKEIPLSTEIEQARCSLLCRNSLIKIIFASKLSGPLFLCEYVQYIIYNICNKTKFHQPIIVHYYYFSLGFAFLLSVVTLNDCNLLFKTT